MLFQKNSLCSLTEEQSRTSILQMLTWPPKPMRGEHAMTRGNSAAQPAPKGLTTALESSGARASTALGAPQIVF